MTEYSLATLNRLRENAGKPPLKSWKASKASLAENIDKLTSAGYSDSIPGAKEDATPQTTDAEIAATLADSALGKSLDNTNKEKEATPQQKPKAKLARGLDTDQMARQSRMAVQMEREKERKAEKDKKREAKEARKEEKKRLKKLKDAAQLDDADKKQIKDEADDRKKGKKNKKPKGEVDAKKEPEKAARQKKHIEDKKKAREGKPAKEKNDKEVTVAELCRELGIDAKQGRAKMRRHEAKIQSLHTKGQDRWTFPKSAKEVLVNILSSKK